jgi:hypothetical protein
LEGEILAPARRIDPLWRQTIVTEYMEQQSADIYITHTTQRMKYSLFIPPQAQS